MTADLIVVSRPGDDALAQAAERVCVLGFEHRASLAQGEALLFSGQVSRRDLAAALDDLAVDWCLHRGRAQRLRLMICDMDSTIIGEECLDELAEMAGVGEKVRAITAKAMAGKLNFEAALRDRVRLLAGRSAALLQESYAQRIHLNEGALELVHTMQAAGAYTALVSGGFTFFTSRIAARAGFATHQANRLVERDGVLTGEVMDPVLGREAKLAALRQYCQDLNIGPAQALAIGDGANDLAMIEAAGLGLAYRAKKILAEAAHAQIRYTALTSALFFQGYTRAEFSRSPV